MRTQSEHLWLYMTGLVWPWWPDTFWKLTTRTVVPYLSQNVRADFSGRSSINVVGSKQVNEVKLTSGARTNRRIKFLDQICDNFFDIFDLFAKLNTVFPQVCSRTYVLIWFLYLRALYMYKYTYICTSSNFIEYERKYLLFMFVPVVQSLGSRCKLLRKSLQNLKHYFSIFLRICNSTTTWKVIYWVFLFSVFVKKITLLILIIWNGYQIMSLAVLWAIKSVSITSIAFPVMLVVICVIRKSIECLFTNMVITIFSLILSLYVYTKIMDTYSSECGNFLYINISEQHLKYSTH